ncbi:helix-turn-helix domain-containing protein [Flagellimonas zhangzhouensis]|uniref:Plasmid maintenance system antidote protein VapI, contains XRE-type HTH domain n=1 Tax=Flagellimonas zhangzhouensis TaxID=1073328 RepID=A0A1H2SPI0_9FLAO|nr:helix-turn-helix transcriptional regulator [Allomuricauda zhangzhouensis]SDQ77517.1 Plasmid maintenance system antidote protein VapI, contains XRE-type HTH domain [Allomuricauda zhangzhouensis]SDW33500.1 Plasmid maintenance system antidote protein VapI, contains XRE-type HTH domain [Allomuricauda zhangzhouensis]
MDIIDRVKQVIEHYGISVSAFADEIGVQRSSMSHLLNGRNKPSLDFVMKLVDSYPEVNLYWLLKGEGEFLVSETPAQTSLNAPIQFPDASLELEKKIPETKPTPKNIPELVKIVWFYSDGTFKAFIPEND